MGLHTRWGLHNPMLPAANTLSEPLNPTEGVAVSILRKTLEALTINKNFK